LEWPPHPDGGYDGLMPPIGVFNHYFGHLDCAAEKKISNQINKIDELINKNFTLTKNN